MKKKDLVSVIMPTYNASRYIGASIESILSQTYKNLELLITDDHSTDPEILELLQSYAERDKRVRIFLMPENNGPGYARNNSIKEAQEQTVSSVEAAREQILGVSSDEELEFMIMFQNAYNASSRYINVVSEMLEHLVTTLGS